MKICILVIFVFLLISCNELYDSDDNSSTIVDTEGNNNEEFTDSDTNVDEDEISDIDVIDDKDNINDENVSDELFNDEMDTVYNGIRKISVGRYVASAIINEKVYTWGTWDSEDPDYPEMIDVSYALVELDFKGSIDQEKPISVASGANHSCALFDNGRLFCWGSNRWGQLGNNSSIYAFIPREIDMSYELREKKVLSVTCGTYHTCIIADDNDAYCWGGGEYGQLGSVEDESVPSPKKVYSDVLDDKKLIQIDSGSAYTCVLDSDGMLYCWGQLYLGEMIEDNNKPYLVGEKWGLDKRKIVDVSCGDDHLCVIDSKYRVFCLGRDNEYLKLGVSDDDADLSFAEVTRVAEFRTVKPARIACGQDFSCVNDDSDNVYCWGYQNYCNFGSDDSSRGRLPEEVAKSELVEGKIVDISASWFTVCVLDDLGKVYCRGSNHNATLGTGTDVVTSCDQTETAQNNSVKDEKFSEVVTREQVTCGITEDRDLYCWGKYAGSHNSDHYPDNYLVPVALGDEYLQVAQNIKKVSIGNSHSCYLDDSDDVYCWGDNSKGSLGNSTYDDSQKPVLVDALDDIKVTDISVGSDHSCALDSKGRVYCWGSNSYGQLGTGDLDDSSFPIEIDLSGVLYGKKIFSLKSGDNYVCVLSESGSVYCWGHNNKGQLGNGTIEDSSVPVKIDDSGVLAGKVVESFDVFSGHVCVVDTEGSVYCWGSNSSGQLGNGTIENSSVPVKALVGDIDTVRTVTVSVGWMHTCSIDEFSNIYCWGLLKVGEKDVYGKEDEEDDVALFPVEMDKGDAFGKSIAQIDSGFFYTCMIGEEGVVYCWGKNSEGQLGDSSNIYRDLPVTIY